MTGRLKRRIKALEKASGVGDADDARRWYEWNINGRKGRQPRGRGTYCKMVRQALLELSND